MKLRYHYFFILIFLLFTFSFGNISAETVLPKKDIALTFDDGPYGTPTTEILDILKKEKINATFFVLGENVQKYPEITKQIILDGNVIGNHTYDHPKNLAKMPSKDFDLELSSTENLISSVDNVKPNLFRAPYGLTSPGMLKELKKDKYTLVGWSLDTQDWNYSKVTPDLIEKGVLKKIKPNSIILFHDGRDTHIDYPRDNLVKALPVVIDSLRKEGYSFVTVDKLINKKAYN